MSPQSQEAIESLRSIPLFRDVAESDLHRIADGMIERRFPEDSTILQEGQPGDYMYVLREGRVKVTKLSGGGRETILEILDAGSFFGEMALFDPPDRSASVTTLDPVRVLAISRADFLNSLRQSSDLALGVIRELAQRLRRTDRQASALPFQSVRERTKELLRALAREDTERDGWLATPALTHQEIADMIATSRETVTRVIKQLKQAGWLTQDGKRYCVCVKPEE